jgi:hypothetical protein
MHGHTKHSLIESVQSSGVHNLPDLITDRFLKLSLVHDLSHLRHCEISNRLLIKMGEDFCESLQFGLLNKPGGVLSIG